MNLSRARNGGRHDVRVGDRQHGGQVWAQPKTGDPTIVAVGVAELGAQMVEIPVEAVRELRDGLTEILHELGRE